MQDGDLPTGLWLDAQLAKFTAQGGTYYITQKGNHGSGVILLKILDRAYNCALQIQQRNLDGKMGWVDALNKEKVAEKDADDYIQRSIQRDPDLWVVEIEQENLINPFE